eukprot:GHUV01012116.1.p1 GENE.GHUV01012116.1~~GHUV01012116.1.p1  ORF type:complete len:129 (-),score=28.65 GHUV01012116.1:1068-1454(-)
MPSSSATQQTCQTYSGYRVFAVGASARPSASIPALPQPLLDSLCGWLSTGIAAEGLKYDEVMGQTADLSDLQRILLRSKTKLSAQQQQNITRWAVWRAAMLLKQYSTEHKVALGFAHLVKKECVFLSM